MSLASPVVARIGPFLAGLVLCNFVAMDAAHAAAPAPAGLPRVAIVAAETNAAALSNPQANLMASGRFSQVDIINANSTTPTLAQLLDYEAVITWSNQSYLNSTMLGNVMADYVDAGGGVVVAVFANAQGSLAATLQGRWVTGGYRIMTANGYTTGSTSLGIVVDPAHPLVAGVSSFSGGTGSFRPSTTAMTPLSLVIATWADGRLLIAQHGTLAARVDLGFYPPSNQVVSTSWVSTTNGAAMLSNALAFVAAASTTPEPYCFGDGTGAPCPCGNSGIAGRGCANSVDPTGARIVTGGVTRLTADSLVLNGSGMPNGPALYLQGMTQSAGGAGFPFGDGLRCAGSPIVRLKHVMNVAGASHLPETGDAGISAMGFVTAPGTRTYQAWYRDAAPFCTASTFNLTNGVQVTWTN
jgi:hypothetical protein